MILESNKTYSDILVDDIPANILLGGDSYKFEPEIKYSKWDNSWFKIKHPATTVETEIESFSDNTISLIVKDTQHKYYIDKDGNLEYEYILLQKPPSNIVEFDIDFSKDLKFHYQDTLENDYAQNSFGYKSLESYLLNNNRPKKNEKSYVIYSDNRNNQYKTGKVGFIQRALITDFGGSITIGDLNINPVTKKMYITIDPDWLFNAVCPIIIDPTIGNTGIGGSSGGIADLVFGFKYTCGTTGTANPGTFYIYGAPAGGDKVTGIVYSDNSGPDARLSSAEAEITLSGTAWASGAITYTGFTATVDYWISFISDGNTIYYDSVGGDAYAANTYGDGIPDPFPGSPSSASREHSCYVDYTEGAPTGAIMNQLQKNNLGADLFNGSLS